MRGAFTGAIDNRTGRFEAAHTGTIFLDEINSTTPHLQVKLLRALQEREFERVGDTQTIRVDTRVIAASNRDLLVRGQRRPLPRGPLLSPQRGADPPAARCASGARTFPSWSPISSTSTMNKTTATWPTSSRGRWQRSQEYDWPGNVRELQNYVERAVVMAPGDELTFKLLPEVVASGRQPRTDRPAAARFRLARRGAGPPWASRAADKNAEDLHCRIVDRVEREVIAQVLAECDGVQIKAASRLGINRNTLHKKLKQYGLDGDAAAARL